MKSYAAWTLNDFLGMAGDIAWIHQFRNDFADTLRDYRNMVHPYNAFNRGYFVDSPLATICWEVVRAESSIEAARFGPTRCAGHACGPCLRLLPEPAQGDEGPPIGEVAVEPWAEAASEIVARVLRYA